MKEATNRQQHYWIYTLNDDIISDTVQLKTKDTLRISSEKNYKNYLHGCERKEGKKANFLTETMEAKRQWNDIFQIMKAVTAKLKFCYQ